MSTITQSSTYNQVLDCHVCGQPITDPRAALATFDLAADRAVPVHKGPCDYAHTARLGFRLPCLPLHRALHEFGDGWCDEATTILAEDVTAIIQAHVDFPSSRSSSTVAPAVAPEHAAQIETFADLLSEHPSPASSTPAVASSSGGRLNGGMAALTLNGRDLPHVTDPFIDDYGQGACWDDVASSTDPSSDEPVYAADPDPACPDCTAANTVGGWRFRNANDAHSEPQPIPWVIEGLLVAMFAALVSGLPRAMKSLVWLCACIEAAAGLPVWKHFPVGRRLRTLFLESEDPEWKLDERVRGFCTGLNITTPRGFHYARIGPIDLVNSEKEISAALERYRPDFVVLSTLQNLVNGANLKEQTDMAEINKLVLKLTEKYRCPFVVLTHSPLDPRQKRAYGSVITQANYGTLMHLEKFKKNSRMTAATLLDVGKSGTDDPEFYLKLETEDVPTSAGNKLVSEVRRVVYVQKHAAADSDQVVQSARPAAGRAGQAAAAIRADLKANPNLTVREIVEKHGVTDQYARKIRKEYAGTDPVETVPIT